jgi:SAM-dependent methyltransferase
MNTLHLQVCASPEWREIVEEKILPEALRGVDLGTDVIEIGPGPGFTTDVLKSVAARLTAVELDPELAASLEARLAESNVRVICGDAVSLDLPSESFTGAASFHMLHHIETAEHQDRVFGELARVLEPGGVLVAADGVENEGSRGFHEDDIYNPIDPDDLGLRLATAGFVSVDIRTHELGWVCSAIRA